ARKANVAAPGTDAAILFEVVEERTDKGGTQILDRHRRGGSLEAELGESEQCTERVAVARDRVRAGLALTHQAVREERLQESCQLGPFGHSRRHRDELSGSSSLAAACLMSSGTADRYQ